MRKLLTLSASLIALGSGAALAADLPRYSPPPPVAYTPVSAYDWSGFYVGVQGGYDWNQVSTASGGFTYPANLDGGILGIYAGYNWMFASNWLLGIDASINYDWAKGSATSGGPLPTSNSAGPDWKGFIRGRLGYTWDRFLLYGTAGAAAMHYNASTTGPAGSGTATPWGWTLGIGGEMAITQNITARLDYSYQDYGTFTASGSGSFASGVPVSAKSHTLMLGVAAKF